MTAAGTNLETEIKLRMPDAAEALARLVRAGLRVTRARTFESNTVFDTPESSVRARRELVRLRRSGEKTVLTFKGAPFYSGGLKHREEIEVDVSPAEGMETILARMGYTAALRYEKFRTELARDGEPGVATIDETPMGVFVELEGPADWIGRTAAGLGSGPEDFITQSYLSLWEDHCRTSGRGSSQGMVFGPEL